MKAYHSVYQAEANVENIYNAFCYILIILADNASESIINAAKWTSYII